MIGADLRGAHGGKGEKEWLKKTLRVLQVPAGSLPQAG